MVKQLKAEVNTTQLPAKSASPFICCAIAKETIAQGVPKIAINVTKSIPLNPQNIATLKTTAGTKINLLNTHLISCDK